jgi:tetratricopeptide (TPR) repeat protein
MKTLARVVSALLLGALAPAAANAKAPDAYDLLAKGSEPKAVAARLPSESVSDLKALNTLRLRLKAEGKEAVAQAFFAALAARKPTDEVLLNLSLSHVDQMMGKSLLQQGNLSSRSQDAVEPIIKRNPRHWVAWYIRGLNNLYWPDWFRKASTAQEYLAKAVALHEQLGPVEQDEDDKYALGYLALGDAYALLDQPAQAKQSWQQGLRFYPYVAVLRERLAIADAELHAKVRALRDADKPVDTDLSFMWGHLSPTFTVTLTGGTLFGPGPLPDQPLNPGRLANMVLGSAINGHIPAFNNRGAEPNLPGEILQGKAVDGLLSDGTEANENIDVGFVSLMNGKFRLFLSAVQDGPNKGKINFFLDDGWHWTILDDIAIDPGFPVGVIKFQDFTFSTSPRVLPVSRQTEAKSPAGVDQSGSIPSGGVVPGALGDANFDGRLDGTLNAIGRFPYDSVLLPGTPFAQTRVFDTDIPVTSAQAALLTLANALSHLRLAIDLQGKYPEMAKTMRKTFNERIETARRHAEQARLPDAARQAMDRLQANAGEAELCAAWNLLNEAAPAQGLRKRGLNASGIKIACPK